MAPDSAPVNLKFWVLVVAFAAGIAVGAKGGGAAWIGAEPRVGVAIALGLVMFLAVVVLTIRKWSRRRPAITTKSGSGRSATETWNSGRSATETWHSSRPALAKIPAMITLYILLVAAFAFAGLVAGATRGTPIQSQNTPTSSRGIQIPSNDITNSTSAAPNTMNGTKAGDGRGTGAAKGPIAQAVAGAKPVLAIRQYISQTMSNNLPKDEAGLMMGIVIGDTVNISPETKADFKTTGLSHILAVSGMNVTILVLAVGLLCGRLLNRLGSTQRANQVVRTIVYLLTSLIIVSYMVICGLQASILRAGLMGVIALSAVQGARRINPPAAMAAAAFTLLAFDPAILFDIGFQLSFGATIAIVVLNQPLLDYISITPRTPSLVENLLAVTIAAQAGVAPILAAVFGRLSLITFAANVAVEPAIAPTQVIGMLMPVCKAVSPTLATAAAWPAHLALLYISAAARWFAAWPYASVAVPTPATPVLTNLLITIYYSAIAGAYLYHAKHPPKASLARDWPGRRWARKATAAIIIITVTLTAFGCRTWQGRPPAGLRVTFLDVGQGDAVLIQASDGATILIDGGPNPDSTEPTLRGLGVIRINLLITSHQHSDHTNGLAAVTRDYTIDRAIVPPRVTERPPSAWSRALTYLANRGAAQTTAKEGEQINVGRYLSVEILSPDPGEAGMNDPNKGAVVALIKYKKVRILFAGDIDTTTEDDLISDGQAGPVDVFKVPHHGSRTGANARFLSLIRPKLAVISVGVGNPYHHPAPTTLDALRRIGARVFRTDQNGSVTIESDGARITASTSK